MKSTTTTDKLPRSRFQKRPSSQQVTGGGATTQHVSDDDDRGSDMCWCPRPMVFFQFVLSARITASFFSNISDCDETFNYWEPTHYLLYGSGFQTWEYSPTYAIRSYAYLNLHAIFAKVMKDIFGANKITVFYYVRFFLAILCAACETYFYKSIMIAFGSHVARLYLAFTAVSTGMFISACAFLPSSFTMYMCLIAYGGWMRGDFPVAIFGIAFGTLVGWPFFAVVGVPIAFDAVVRRRLITPFVMWAGCIGVAILIPLIAIDSHYYGKNVLAPLNIVLYNVFGGGGPDLYGVEPWTFYFVNGILNFNFVFLLALVSLPVCLIVAYVTKDHEHPLRIPTWLCLSGLYIWVAIFFTRPHKEERFLFPVYPLILLNACLCLAKFQRACDYFFPPTKKPQHHHYADRTNWLAVLLVAVFSVLSLSRSAALFTNYHAPLDVYPQLNNLVNPIDDNVAPLYKPDEQINVCVGREWYRYPSSFFLPENWKYQFLKSEFAGQLPQQYATGADATKVIPPNMNDMNREEMSVYTTLDQCDLLIDVDMPGETKHEPAYSRDTKRWEVVYSSQFLDVSRSHRFFRAFYVPGVSWRYVKFVGYNLLKSRQRRKHVKVKRMEY